MITIDCLREYGANVEEGLARCMGNEELYLRLVSSVALQSEFTRLSELIAQGDLKSAFEASHALKGVLGNLALTPLYLKVCELTELLRAETSTDYGPLLSEISALWTDLKNIVL